jgi:hypothetical protein
MTGDDLPRAELRSESPTLPPPPCPKNGAKRVGADHKFQLINNLQATPRYLVVYITSKTRFFFAIFRAILPLPAPSGAKTAKLLGVAIST